MQTQKFLISQDQNIRESSVYGGYLILKQFKKQERISIFELYQMLRTNDKNFTYSNTMYALIFLYMNGLIDFDEPYLYYLKQ